MRDNESEATIKLLPGVCDDNEATIRPFLGAREQKHKHRTSAEPRTKTNEQRHNRKHSLKRKRSTTTKHVQYEAKHDNTESAPAF